MRRPEVAQAEPAPPPGRLAMTAATLDRLERGARRLAIPPPRLSVADWLDANRVIPRSYPSPFPGPWRTARTPYLREPLNDFVDPEVETLVLLFSSQVGKSEMLLGSLLYAYGIDPGPGMLCLPTLELAGGVSTDRLAPALESCPSLVVGAVKKSRATDNAILHKRINGLPLTIAGANSPASLSSRPVRYVWCDEIDRWPATTPEGDPLSLVKQRTAAFRRRKLVLTSTPTVKGGSRIEDWYAQSDQRTLHAPCPRCGALFVVEWHHVRWDTGEPATAHLECPSCYGRIEDAERKAMFEAAVWRPTAPFRGVRGYRTWAIVSPWLRLQEMVEQFLVAKDRVETLQSWVNLTRGESWEPPSEKVETAALLMRREQYPAEVPAGAKVLTAGVDTQDDRLEALVVGWNLPVLKVEAMGSPESWVISRESFFGDPARPEVWRELDEFLMRPWPREVGGATRIQYTLVDSGFKTSAVYGAVVPRQQPLHLFASKGRDGGLQGQIVVAKTLATAQGRVHLHHVDVSQVKGLVYGWLRSEAKSGPGVAHFPMTVGDVFFTELTAEQLLTERNKYRVPTKRWALRPGHERNESLDCYVAAYAALRALCKTPARFSELAAKLAASSEASAPAGRPAPRRGGPRTSNWSPP